MSNQFLQAELNIETQDDTICYPWFHFDSSKTSDVIFCKLFELKDTTSWVPCVLLPELDTVN